MFETAMGIELIDTATIGTIAMDAMMWFLLWVVWVAIILTMYLTVYAHYVLLCRGFSNLSRKIAVAVLLCTSTASLGLLMMFTCNINYSYEYTVSIDEHVDMNRLMIRYDVTNVTEDIYILRSRR